MTKWQGSLVNRIQENKADGEIKVGMGMTEYHWSDRDAYEVIDVKDQKHITVRELSHRKADDVWYSNNWELYSDENNPTYNMAKRGKYWYYVVTWTKEDVDALKDDADRLYLTCNGWDLDKIAKVGKQTQYRRANVSFGRAEYYYDYEF